MISKLSDLCFFADGRVAVADLDLDSYISTENMLPNKEGITRSSGLPTVSHTQAYQVDDVLVSNIRPYFRKIWFADRDGGCSNDVLVLRAKETCNPGFLYYLLSDNNFFAYATATGKGTKMPRGDKGAIMRYAVPDVPFDNQIEIASTLSVLDAQVTLNKKINHHLEQMAMAIFKSWFVNFEPFDGEIPDDWRTASLREIAEIKHGYAFKGEYFCDEPTPYLLVTPGNFAIGGGFLEKPKYYNGPIPQSFILKQNDLIVTMTDLSKQGDTLGYSALVPASDLYLHNQRIGLVSVEKKLKDFLYWLMRTREYQRFIVNHASGSTVKHTSPKSILSYEFVLPDDSTLETIGPVFRQINELVTHNFTESVRLAALRGALLPRLMSGELSVGDI